MIFTDTFTLLEFLFATSKLISKLFEPKFSIARIKLVIVDCIAPMIAAELRQELDRVNFVSLTIDSSNRKEQGRRRAGTLAP